MYHLVFLYDHGFLEIVKQIFSEQAKEKTHGKTKILYVLLLPRDFVVRFQCDFCYFHYCA